MGKHRCIIGIDLGTTNSAVSSVDLSRKGHVEIFQVPQITGLGEMSNLNTLPSFLYLPGDHEIPKGAIGLPWDPDIAGIVGPFAREQGAKVPKRLVSSAKSWLCHGKVDRTAPILPWGGDDQETRVSPVEATAAYLRHIRKAWNHVKGGDNRDLDLEDQMVIITVPASFDEVARDLTVEAAGQAGIRDMTLLEEPLAVFYNWLMGHEQKWDQFIRPGDLILVCDVGGGTTDFTLITLKEAEERPVFERLAVGDHLILGGDNMDLAIARRLELRLNKKNAGSLNIHRWQALCHQCRQAKEEILNGLSASKTITLVGEGRRLISDTLSATLDRIEVEESIVDGFFPLITPDDPVSEGPRQGMTEFGLPYAKDPAITRHLIRFLEQHRRDVAEALGKKSPKPDFVMFNGGVLKPTAIQERIRTVIGRWFNETDGALPRVLPNSDLDLAVARGASYYGLVKTGRGLRVGSGTARAYYLGVGDSKKGDPKTGGTQRAVCLVERGMEEGSKIELDTHDFSVLTNRQVSLDLYSSSFRTGDHVGDVINIDDSIRPLPPVRTVIHFGKKGKETILPVRMAALYTELGTLSLWCMSTKTNHSWQLQFQIRDPDQAVAVPEPEVYEESTVDQALKEVKESFSNRGAGTPPERLVKTIVEIVRSPREKWPIRFIRQVADELILLADRRKAGPEHEGRWLNIVGYCMRPGFGDVLDESRIQMIWKIFRTGPVHDKKAQVRSEWWVLWRRIAGGLDIGRQRQVLEGISALLTPRKKGAKRRLAPQEHMEIWMALANLERLGVQDKAAWGRLLLDELSPKKSRPQLWWSLSRIGAREPLYGPLDRVISPKEASRWVQGILSRAWKNPRPVGMALSQIARRTGDRRRDLEPEVIKQIVGWLTQFDWSGPHIRLLEEIVPIAPLEESAIFGESLPSGILLHGM